MNTNASKSPTATLVALFIMENRDQLTVDNIAGLIDFSTWARVREEDEYFVPEQAAQIEAITSPPLQPATTLTVPAKPKAQSELPTPELKMNDGQRPTRNQIAQSIENDSIISFIDGRRYKSLRPHLGRHSLTPEAYREKFGLPDDYPMVAPGFSAQRSAIARKAGFGGRQGK